VPQRTTPDDRRKDSAQYQTTPQKKKERHHARTQKVIKRNFERDQQTQLGQVGRKTKKKPVKTSSKENQTKAPTADLKKINGEQRRGGTGIRKSREKGKSDKRGASSEKKITNERVSHPKKKKKPKPKNNQKKKHEKERRKGGDGYFGGMKKKGKPQQLARERL